MSRVLATPRYIEEVVTLRFEAGACNGCGMCVDVCPHGVFARAKKTVLLRDPGACMECGACVRNCPEGAVYVHPGVGCAMAIIKGWFTRSEASCGCQGGGSP